MNLVIGSEHTSKNGVKHLRLHQEIDGLRVHGSSVKAAVKSNGQLSHLIEKTARSNGKRMKASISADAAIEKAVAHNFGAGRSAEFFHKAPSAEKVMIARNSGALKEGYLVQNWSQTDNRLYHTLVDGKGRIVENELRTAEDSYNVYTDHPLAGNQTIIAGPGAGNAQSPNDWLSGSQSTLDIRGNNVSAYLDRDNNNSTDGGGSAVTDGNFLTSHFPTQSPLFADNQEVAVQNLFYLNNLIHDDLYGHGFVEAR
jgi:Zn-dependent metalloprotease